MPINQNVEISACLHSSCFGLQFQLYCKISFPLEFSNIAYNIKCNTEFMKTAILHFAKWKSVQAISPKNEWCYKTLFLRKKSFFHWNLSSPRSSPLSIPKRAYEVREVECTPTSKKIITFDNWANWLYHQFGHLIDVDFKDKALICDDIRKCWNITWRFSFTCKLVHWQKCYFHSTTKTLVDIKLLKP